MQISINKTKLTSTIILAILITSAFSLIANIPVQAQIGIPQPTESAGYISIAPTLIGVGQTATVNLWIFPLPENYFYEPLFGGYTGITVTFTKPDGTKDTFMPVDGTGQFGPGQTSHLALYSSIMRLIWRVIGVYHVTMPAQTITDATGTVLYQACTSEPAYFTVQLKKIGWFA